MSSSTPHLDNPYPGLRPFHFSESLLFFGRRRHSEELLRKLRRSRFLAVVGTSGSGKSSLVRAGLLPLLDKGLAAEAGERWRVALFRPGNNPISNLALALNSPEAFRRPYADGGDEREGEMLRVAVVETILRRSALGLTEHARRVSAREGENLLVCVDQFEELFRFKEKSPRSNPEDEAAAFVKLLLEAARGKGASVYVVLTMRSDFLGDCAQFQGLPEAINDGQYLIPRMTRDEQHRAIAEPAARRGAELAPRLVQRLLNDVSDNPDQLPLLQHALMRTWEHWRDEGGRGAIDFDDYTAVGGIEHALSWHAQKTFEALPDDRARAVAERLFKALTETVANDRKIRRPAELAELCAACDADEREVISVIEHFRGPSRSFLMPPPGAPLTPGTVIDITHESLIKGWQLLGRWVEEEAKSKATYQRIADAARRHYGEEGSAGLWRDPDLKFALDWLKHERPNKTWASRYDPNFDDALRFLDDSEKERERQLRAERAREERERQREEQERQRELRAAQEAALQQQLIAETEHRRAEEAKLREEAERQRAEKEKRLAETERERAEEQATAARRLRRAAARLWVVVGLLIVTLLVTAGFAYYAYEQSVRAREEQARADENAENLKRTAGELAIKSDQLRDELNKSLKLSEEREEARRMAAEGEKRAREAEAKAEEQTRLAVANAAQLKVALNAANTARQNEEKAREREDLERAGLVSLEKGETAQAASDFQNLLAIYGRDPSREGQLAWSWASYNLGTAHRQARDYDKARERYEDALRKQKELSGDKSPEIVPALTRLAQVHHALSNYKEAGGAYDSLETLLGELRSQAAGRGETSKQAAYQERLVGVGRDRARLLHDEARDNIIQARQKKEQGEKLENEIESMNGPDGSGLTVKQENRAGQLRLESGQLESEAKRLTEEAARKYAAAEDAYQKVAEAREAQLPASHAELVEAYNELAAFYQDRALSFEDDFSSVKEAEDTRERAKRLYKLARTLRQSDLTHAATDEGEATKLEELAEEFGDERRFGAAARFSQRAVEIRKPQAEVEIKDASSEVGSTLAYVRSLGMTVLALYNDKRDPEARPYYDELLRAMRALGDKPNVFVDFSDDDEKWTPTLISDDLFELEKYAEALEVTKLEIALRRKYLSGYTDEALRKRAVRQLEESIFIRAITEYKLGNYKDAEDSLKEGRELIRSVYGPDTKLDYMAARVLGELYFKWGRHEEALIQYQRVLTVFASKFGPKMRAAPQEWFGSDSTFMIDNEEVTVGPFHYLAALHGIAEIHSRLNRNPEAERTYGELLSAAEWMIQNERTLTYPLLKTHPGQVESFKDICKELYADALESYAAFLKKPDVGRAAEAKPLEAKAAGIRARLGPKRVNPLFK